MLKPSEVLIAAADLLEKGWCQVSQLGDLRARTHQQAPLSQDVAL